MAEVSKEIHDIKEDYESKYGFSDPENYNFKAKKGLTEETVKQISQMKGEPEWMLDFRLNALKIFFSRPMPEWGYFLLHKTNKGPE
jgi:Fe-S cluster assembly protein SufB